MIAVGGAMVASFDGRLMIFYLIILFGDNVGVSWL
jgi:hypothetical protein